MIIRRLTLAMALSGVVAPAFAITCTPPPLVISEHMTTRTTITASINAGSAAVVGAIATQSTVLLGGLEAINKSVQVGVDALTKMIEAQTAEQQRFTQDQTNSLLAGLSHSADFRYGDVQTSAGGTRVQITPHPADACEQVAVSAAVSASRTPRENYQQTARTNAGLHAGGKRFRNARAAEAWAAQQPDVVARPTALTEQTGVMSKQEAERASDMVLMLLDPAPPPGVSDTALARAGNDPAVKIAVMASERRSGSLAPAVDAINRLASMRMPTVPLDSTTRNLYPNWDWSKAVDSSTGNTSALEMIRLRSSYDYFDPNYERILATENQRSLLARLNRNLSVANALSYERFAIEREQLLLSSKQFADDVKSEGDLELKRLVIEADRAQSVTN